MEGQTCGIKIEVATKKFISYPLSYFLNFLIIELTQQDMLWIHMHVYVY